MSTDGTIRIVDDDHTPADPLGIVLRLAGMRGEAAPSGWMDLAAIDPESSAAVILDNVTPDVGGLPVSCHLRSHDATASLPVIMLSSRVDDECANRI